MPIPAIALLFGSAILHTTWNLILKQAGEKSMASWWSMLMGSLLFLPALPVLGLPARSTWALLGVSAFMGASYFFVLPFAYTGSDFSLVYPMARGAAPALIAAWSILFLGERLTPGGMTGLLVIVAGLTVVGGSSWIAARNGAAPGIAAERGQAAGAQPSGIAGVRVPSLKGVWPALLMALIISIYSVIDGAAVKRTGPLPYAALIYFVSALWMTPYVLSRHGWPALKREFIAYHWRLLLTGALIVVAYLLALWAYRLSSVSYSGAIREVGVVMGAVAGWQFLGEKFGPVRVLGALVIFTGILVIAIFG
jgi:drug/metabolite transporter (DMT)-like permease